MKLGQAPILEPRDMRALIDWSTSTASPERDEVLVRLSLECGLRAIEIGAVQWGMVYEVHEARWQLRPYLLLHKKDSKGGYGGRELRIVPHGLGLALDALRAVSAAPLEKGFVLQFRSHALDRYPRADTVRKILRRGFIAIDKPEASSHSGRRTLITELVRSVGVKNAMKVAGHRSVATTLLYEEPDRKAINRVLERFAITGPRVLKMAKAGLRAPAAARRSS